MSFVKLDVMSPSISFKVNKSDRYKSNIGLFLTLIYFSLVILAFIAFGRDIFEKKNPRVTFNQEVTPDSFYKLSSENLIFAIYQQADHKIIPNLEQKLVAYFDVFYNYPGGYDTYTYGFSKCSEATLETFKDSLVVDKSSYYCLSNNIDITLTGSKEDKIFWSSRLNVDYCTEGKFNKTECLPIDQIKETIGIMNMDFFILDYYPDSFNYDEPFKQTFFRGTITSSVGTFSRITVDYKNVNYKTDIGWIVEDIREEIKNSVLTYTNVVIQRPTTVTLFSHLFLNSKWKDQYVRGYIKIQEIFASIGGIISIINIILKFICDYLVFPDILSMFYNQINKSPSDKKQTNFFQNNNSFDKNNLEKVNNYVTSFTQQNFQELSSSNTNNNIINTNNIVNTNNNNLLKLKNKENNKEQSTNLLKQVGYVKTVNNKSINKVLNFKFENLTLWEKTTRVFNCLNNEKKKKYNIVRDYYHQMFSFEYCINSFRRQEILRFLILDEKQNFIVEHIDMPDLEHYYDDDIAKSMKDLNEGKLESDGLMNTKLKLLLN